MSRTRQMRRHARKMRRNGLQPMVIIDRDDQFPDVAALLVARAMWRYRSELAPVYLVTVLVLGGAVLHLTHAGWWPWLLAAAVVVAWVLALFGDRVGLSLRIERIYAATVAMSGGGWLSAATALGVTFRPLPLCSPVAGCCLPFPGGLIGDGAQRCVSIGR